MITYGVRKVKLFSHGPKCSVDVVRGYYLVLPNEDRHWISSDVHVLALERACRKYLDSSYKYWIDYCHGYDVNGNLAWSNVDHTDSFI